MYKLLFVYLIMHAYTGYIRLASVQHAARYSEQSVLLPIE